MNKIIHNPHIQGLTQKPVNSTRPKKSFNEVLDHIVKQQDVKFSKHAMQRLEARNIKLNHSDINRINDAIHKANQKGINETLILMDNKAFVASVRNKTVITATMEEQLKDSVFTNIDGAVIV